MQSLSQAEAAERAALMTVESYVVDLDLTVGDTVFRSTTTVRFGSAHPGATTFVELKPTRLIAARLNGTALEPGGLDGNQLALPGLAEANELVVEAEMAYSHSGEGLHRFVDPGDGEVYLYAMSFIDDAQRIFACFDQPDLKAPLTLSVIAPPDWLVAANGAPVGVDGDRRIFAPTLPLATYTVSLIAGPYHARRDEHDGIPLQIFCRRSLADDLDRDADEIFTVTKRCLDRFHELFQIRYPFGKYDQAFVPEFNPGAMENPGLVTLRDDYVFRSAVTEAEREQRATTIAHELAHMWFGNLVTMRWWDDLWLNESFAEYLGIRVTVEATVFAKAWTTFATRRKAWGYADDQRPFTHPVAPHHVPDAAQAMLNFDGISYAKGASVLRQLAAWLGDDAFFKGLRAYFAAHRFGNATLADLLDALSRASGRDLTAWADAWLRRAQVNTLRADVTVTRRDGAYKTVHIVQTAPCSHPILRPHRIGIGVYDGAVLRERLEVDLDPAVDGGRTPVPALAGQPVTDLLLLNDGDLTYAKIRLDDGSAAALPTTLPTLPEPLARAVVWGSVLDAVRDGDEPPAKLADLVIAAIPAETEAIIVDDVLTRGVDLLERYLSEGPAASALAQVDKACERLLASAPPGGSLQLVAARKLIALDRDVSRLQGWLAGTGLPGGLEIDAELRWQITYRLAALGAANAAQIDGELAADRTANGEQWAARCLAALPDPQSKERSWRIVTTDTTLSKRLVEAHAHGFWRPEQARLLESYVDRYFAEMPAAARLRTPWMAEGVARAAFPRYAVQAHTREAAAAVLDRDDLLPGLRKAIAGGDDDIARALAARSRW